ncbi:MFS transporter [Mesorhizobium sp. ORM6]
MAAVLAGFVVIGAALPVLPLHVSHNLGFGSVVVGMVAGTQFAASLVSRVWSGSFADANGGKRAVLVGLVTAAAAGLLYLVSVAVANSPVLSVSILVVGRAVLGGAESFIITGGVAWGLALVEAGHSGKVIAWVGTAMFAALAFSGPFGTMLFDRAADHIVAVARLGIACASAKPSDTAAAEKLRFESGFWRGMAARRWCGTRQCRLLLNPCLQLPSVCRQSLATHLGWIYGIWSCADRSAYGLRSFA